MLVHTKFRNFLSLFPPLPTSSFSLRLIRIYSLFFKFHLSSRTACRYIFFFFNILTPGRESITRSSGGTKFANSWSEINISSHVIAIIPRDFMGASISADCYRQSHDTHLIFNAIENVESNNSHFCLSSFLCPSVSFYISPPFFSFFNFPPVTFFFSSILRRNATPIR